MSGVFLKSVTVLGRWKISAFQLGDLKIYARMRGGMQDEVGDGIRKCLSKEL